MDKDIRQALEIYEEGERYGNLSIAVVVYNSDDNTALTATDMTPLGYATSMTAALGSFLERNNHEQQFAQDTIMNLLHSKGIEYSKEFADALPTYDKFPRYMPDEIKHLPENETPAQIMARLSK